MAGAFVKDRKPSSWKGCKPKNGHKESQWMWRGALKAMKGGFKKSAAPDPPPATSHVFPSGSLLEPLRVHLTRHHVKEEVIRECEEIVLKTVVQRLQAKLDRHPKEMMQMLRMLRKMEASIPEVESTSAEQKQMQQESAAAEKLLEDWGATIGSSGASSRKHHHQQLPPLIAEIDEELGEEEFEDERREGEGEGEEEEAMATEGQAASLDEFQLAHALMAVVDSQAPVSRHRSPAVSRLQTPFVSCQQSPPVSRQQSPAVSCEQPTAIPCPQPTVVTRRWRLPDPAEAERRLSIWGFLKETMGKDLCKVSVPISFNEPLSIMQKYCEMVEYSHLLDKAYEAGVKGEPGMRVLHVAAFIVSRLCGNAGRTHKPFNPLLGETYEGYFPERGMRYLAESVQHYPPTMAFLAEGRGWRLSGDVCFKVKLWGLAVHCDPQGILAVEFDDGESFTWKNVALLVENVIFGRPFVDLIGEMDIQGNRGYSATLKFREKNAVDRNNPHQVRGFTSDPSGRVLATLSGRWNHSLYYVDGDVTSRNFPPMEDTAPHRMACAKLLWQGVPPSEFARNYKFTPFCIQLNEITPDIEGFLPPTDSRFRPDQRALEEGRHGTAHAEKQRLEHKQRVCLRNHDAGWQARWFQPAGPHGTWQYTGGYWERRAKREWSDVCDIFSSE